MLVAHSILYFMITSPKRKYSGGKIALHSDLRARARLGDAVVAVTEKTTIHRSARAMRCRTAALAAEQRCCPKMHSTTAILRHIHCQTTAERAIPSIAPAAARPNKVRDPRVIVDKKIVKEWLARHADRQTMKVSMSSNAISTAKGNANVRAKALENARAMDTE